MALRYSSIITLTDITSVTRVIFVIPRETNCILSNIQQTSKNIIFIKSKVSIMKQNIKTGEPRSGKARLASYYFSSISSYSIVLS